VPERVQQARTEPTEVKEARARVPRNAGNTGLCGIQASRFTRERSVVRNHPCPLGSPCISPMAAKRLD
jgi:hypothetical protein